MSTATKYPPPDFSTYSVMDLFASGSRFTDDFDEEAAVQMYLELHPDAVEADVRAELAADIKRNGG